MSRHPVTSAILFDLYNTLVSIETDEQDEEIWDRLATFIRYHDVDIPPETLYAAYGAAADRGIELSGERYHQTNELKVFQTILADATQGTDPSALAALAREVVLFFRTLSIRRFELFPDTLPALETLSRRFQLGVVTDAQSVFVEPEMKFLGIRKFFKAVVVSGDYDFHKPDPRLFSKALERLGIGPEAATFVGDNAWRDIGGAKQLNLHTVLLDRTRAFNGQETRLMPDHVIHDLSDLGSLLATR